MFDPLAAVTVGGSASFGGFGVLDILGLDQTTPDGSYTLISGAVNVANVANVGPANAVSLGGTKSAYLEQGSLRLVVVPEPATAVVVALCGAGIAALARRPGVRKPKPLVS